MVHVFEQWFEKIIDNIDNIITDSAYVIGIVMQLEHSYLEETTNAQLFVLLWSLKWFLDHHLECYFIQHVCSHSSPPETISEGSAQADDLAGAVVPDQFAQARLSHDFYHQNAKALQRAFQIRPDSLVHIVKLLHQTLLYVLIHVD